jgi:hypothetical protein
MPNIHKILGQINPSANTQTNVYVVPASTAALVNSILLIILQHHYQNISY